MEGVGQSHQVHHSVISVPPVHRVAATAAGFFAAVMAGLLLSAFHGNTTGFFRMGDCRPPAPALAHREVYVFPNQAGYDGQYYLALALDPALHDPGTFQTLDYPRYRYRRILFPVMGYVLGLGQPALIPYTLPLLNIAAAIGLVWLVARWLQMGGSSGWGGLLVLGILGVWEVLALTTTDLVSSTLVIATLYALRREYPVAAAAALALAALTREVMLLYWGVLLVALLAARNWRALRWLIWAGLPALVWNCYVLYHLPASENGNVVQILFGTPGGGWLEKIQQLTTGGLTGKNLFEALVFLSFLAALVVLPWNLWRLRALRVIWPAASIAVLLTAMLLCAKFFLLQYYLDYSRVFQDLFILLILSLGFAGTARRTTYAVVGVAGLSAVTFLVHYALGLV